ncbi:hypothetical protein EW146_g1890 [Bondarzewia mesenterica]|uniref:Brix domain-containing protein n=1 Tax=Bondarzewia mesenterica TaxID=1095465 RepID=A0A4S4M3W6_9AGAM|nr:hypothetical protein EW146_g1890 [Bondarzewia mesenterica]
MPTSRFEPSSIKNKFKREEIAHKNKKGQSEENPSSSSAAPENTTLTSSEPPTSSSHQLAAESAADISSDPFASYFTSTDDPTVPPKVLITTSPKATRVTYEFCDELVGIFPGAEFHKRPKKHGFEIGKIAGWAAGRGYSNLIVVNEDTKKPSRVANHVRMGKDAITMVHLPDGPTAYFKLTSIQLTKQLFDTPSGGCSKPSSPLSPSFKGDRSSRFTTSAIFCSSGGIDMRSAHQRKSRSKRSAHVFTLKLRSMKKGLPAVRNLAEPAKPLEFDDFEGLEDEGMAEDGAPVDQNEGEGMNIEDGAGEEKPKEATKRVPPKGDEYEWIWKPELESTRRTFFL